MEEGFERLSHVASSAPRLESTHELAEVVGDSTKAHGRKP
jgi:hypothetical protein